MTILCTVCCILVSTQACPNNAPMLKPPSLAPVLYEVNFSMKNIYFTQFFSSNIFNHIHRKRCFRYRLQVCSLFTSKVPMENLLSSWNLLSVCPVRKNPLHVYFKIIRFCCNKALDHPFNIFSFEFAIIRDMKLLTNALEKLRWTDLWVFDQSLIVLECMFNKHLECNLLILAKVNMTKNVSFAVHSIHMCIMSRIHVHR